MAVGGNSIAGRAAILLPCASTTFAPSAAVTPSVGRVKRPTACLVPASRVARARIVRWAWFATPRLTPARAALVMPSVGSAARPSVWTGPASCVVPARTVSWASCVTPPPMSAGVARMPVNARPSISLAIASAGRSLTAPGSRDAPIPTRAAVQGRVPIAVAINCAWRPAEGRVAARTCVVLRHPRSSLRVHHAAPGPAGDAAWLANVTMRFLLDC